MGRTLFVLGMLVVSALGTLTPTIATAQDLDCADFATQAEAQAAIAAEPSQAASLDADGDGEACESLPPGEDDEAMGAAETDPLAARLGGTRASFDQAYGVPDEDGDIPQYDAEGYASLLVLYEEERAVSVTVFADRPLDKPRTEPDQADWTVEEAGEQVERLLPADAKINEELMENETGDLVGSGRSEALAGAVSEETYGELVVGGEPGDLRYTLFLTEGGGVSSVNVGIGTTEEAGTEPIEEGAVANDRCEAVAPEVVAAIEAGLTVDGGVSLRNARAVRSADFEEIWFVAADLEGPGLEGSDDIGVWATNDVNEVGTILAVDGVAKEFSDWPDGDATDANLTTDDDGAVEARECTGAA